jgi:hypothetical protein
MLRGLALALAAAIAVAIAGAQPARPTQAKYIAGVHASGDDQLVQRLFDEVVNYEYLPCRICQRDEQTSIGHDWLRSERRLGAELERFADRLETLSPPREVVHLHTNWVSVVRGCERALHELEAKLQIIDNPDVIYEFQRQVARAVSDRCLDRFEETIDAFAATKFVFASGVSWPPGPSRATFD